VVPRFNALLGVRDARIRLPSGSMTGGLRHRYVLSPFTDTRNGSVPPSWQSGSAAPVPLRNPQPARHPAHPALVRLPAVPHSDPGRSPVRRRKGKAAP